MDITWFGQSAFRIKGKSAAIITDPFSADYTGLKRIKSSADIVTISHQHEDHNNSEVVEGSPFIVPGSGEYEVKGVRIQGIQTFHDSKLGKERGINTMYVIEVDGIFVLHCGDLGHELTAEQSDELPDIDIMLVPVGGVYTIDPEMAVKIIAQVEPKVVIPMHYKIPGLKFDLGSLEEFIQVYGKKTVEPINKYTITKDKLPEDEELVVLEV